MGSAISGGGLYYMIKSGLISFKISPENPSFNKIVTHSLNWLCEASETIK